MSDFPVKTGDTVTLMYDATVNRYRPTERILETGAKARVLAVRKPFPNQSCHYVDIEFIGEFNPDGTPVTGGNWHAGHFAEAHTTLTEKR